MSLVTVTVPTQSSGHVDLIGERVTDNFAITPGITGDGDALGLSDRLALTHIGTGRVVTWSMWLNFRDLAQRLEALPIDWAALTENNLTVEHRKAVHAAIKEAQGVHADRGDDEFPKWAGDPTSPALSLLGTALDDAVKSSAFETFTAGKELARTVEKVDPELARKVELELMWRTAAVNVNTYGVAYLLAVLQRVAPEAADRAARELAAAWECGDSLGEWVWQWRKEIGDGQPLTLHGFADLAFPTEAPDVAAQLDAANVVIATGGGGGGAGRRPVYTVGPGEPDVSGEGIFYPFIERDGVAITENGRPVPGATGGGGGGGGAAHAFHEAWEEAGRDQLIRAEHARDRAYRDRAEILAVLAGLFPSRLVHDADPTAPGWPVLFIATEVGQLSWHIAPDDVARFHPDLHLDAADPWAPKWDGHTDAEKSARLRALAGWVSDRDLAAEIVSLAGVYAEQQERRR